MKLGSLAFFYCRVEGNEVERHKKRPIRKSVFEIE